MPRTLAKTVNSLGTAVRTDMEAVRAIEAGIPVEAVDRLASLAELSATELNRIVKRRTLQRAKGRGRLSKSDGDRIVQAIRLVERSHEVFGGRKVGKEAAGRWNTPGFAAVYTSEHLSLAVLEVLAHLQPLQIPPDYNATEIDLPDAQVDRIQVDDLDSGWRTDPSLEITQRIGSRWLADPSSKMALSVPSVMVPYERNVMLNPAHRAFTRVRVIQTIQFTFDPRLPRMGPR